MLSMLTILVTIATIWPTVQISFEAVISNFPISSIALLAIAFQTPSLLILLISFPYYCIGVDLGGLGGRSPP